MEILEETTLPAALETLDRWNEDRSLTAFLKGAWIGGVKKEVPGQILGGPGHPGQHSLIPSLQPVVEIAKESYQED